LSIKRHKIVNQDDLIKACLFELDRHIRDRLADNSHVKE